MKHYVLGLSLFILGACGVHQGNQEEAYADSTGEVVEEVIVEVVEEIPERGVYHPSETILTDLIHTKLEVNFNWPESRMNGIATITAKPHFYASDQVIFDAKGMDINSVKVAEKELKYTYENDYLTIELGKTYTMNDKFTVVIDYVAKPEERESEGSMAISEAKGLYFINPERDPNGKMPQIWTQGETEASSVWFPTIDAPNAKTTQEIFITVEDKYQTLSNGKLVSSKKLPNGKRVDHWKQDQPHAPYLFMMGVGEFKVVKDFYERPDGSKMPVNYYVEPEWESSAKAIFGETPKMIDFFSKRLGVEYPWDKYHQIVVRDYVSGAMENTGAVVFGDFVYANERELLDGNSSSIIAHELFHHWFGDLVTCESWSNLPLNESFANYSQYLWDEHRYGIDEADYHADSEADGYYQSASMQGHHDLIWYDYNDKEQMFDGHSYNKGGRILHMLRNYLGDDAFFAGLNKYLTDNKYKAAEFHHLRLAFEEVSGEDLNWFFDQWFLGSGHPVLKFRQDLDSATSELIVTVTQEQDFELSPVYKLPFQIAYFDNDGKHIEDVVLDEVEETFRFPLKGELKSIIYDYQQMLLAKKSEKKTREQYIHQYYNGERYFARRDGLLNGCKDRSQAGQQLILDALKDPFWDIRLLAIGKVGRLKEENETKGIELLKEMIVNDPKSSVRSAALNRLGKELEEEELRTIYVERIKTDPSYSVVSSSLRYLAKIDTAQAIGLAENLEKERSSKMISGVAQLYASHSGPEKYDFIAEALSGNIVQGFDKLGLLGAFTQYIRRQDPELIDKAFEVYMDQSENGGFYMTLFMPQNLSFLVQHFDSEIGDLEAEIAEHEANNDVALADQARRKVKAYEELKEKYGVLIQKLEEDNGDRSIIITGGEEEE